jgi:hypothetical protein
MPASRGVAGGDAALAPTPVSEEFDRPWSPAKVAAIPEKRLRTSLTTTLDPVIGTDSGVVPTMEEVSSTAVVVRGGPEPIGPHDNTRMGTGDVANRLDYPSANPATGAGALLDAIQSAIPFESWWMPGGAGFPTFDLDSLEGCSTSSPTDDGCFGLNSAFPPDASQPLQALRGPDLRGTTGAEEKSRAHFTGECDVGLFGTSDSPRGPCGDSSAPVAVRFDALARLPNPALPQGDCAGRGGALDEDSRNCSLNDGEDGPEGDGGRGDDVGVYREEAGEEGEEASDDGEARGGDVEEAEADALSLAWKDTVSNSESGRGKDPDHRKDVQCSSAEHSGIDYRHAHGVKTVPIRRCRPKATQKPPTTTGISLEHLKEVFHLHRPGAERHLNLKRTTFSNLSRYYGISKWPFRTLRDADKRLEHNDDILRKSSTSRDKRRKLETQQRHLRAVKELMYAEPHQSKDSNTLSVLLSLVAERGPVTH